MIFKNLIIVLFLSVVVVQNVVEGCSTTIEGYSFPFDQANDVQLEGVTPLECEERCRQSPMCLAYTYQQKTAVNVCLHFFNTLGSVIACTGGTCTTATITRMQPGVACDDTNQHLIDQVVTSTAQQCLDQCEQEAACKHFLYYNAEMLFCPTCCFMFGTKCQHTRPCQHCQSGDLFCLNPTTSTTTSATTPAAPTSTTPDAPTSTTSAAPTSTTPAAPTTSSPPPTPHQCFDYMVMDDASRNIHYSYERYTDNSDSSDVSPDWFGEGWYRLQAEGGNYISESNPGPNHCGTKLPGYLTTSHPTQVGDSVYGTMCFDGTEYGHEDCIWPKDIRITRCNGYYVYYLVPTAVLSDMELTRYCATFDI